MATRIFTILIAVSLMTGCQTGRKRPNQGGSSSPVVEDSMGPSPAPSHKGVVLVLGPGLARGYAYIGAIRALYDAKVPIAAILGTEMGALIAAAYGSSSSIHQFEWGLERFKKPVFIGGKGGLASLFGSTYDGRDLSRALSKVFGAKRIESTRVPIRIALQEEISLNLHILSRGSIRRAVRSALSVPGIFSPGKWNGLKAVSAGRDLPFLVESAKKLDIGPVVVLNVLGQTNGAVYQSGFERQVSNRMKVIRNNGASALEEADYVLSIDLSKIGYLDFHQRTEISYLGKKAVTNHLSELRELVDH